MAQGPNTKLQLCTLFALQKQTTTVYYQVDLWLFMLLTTTCGHRTYNPAIFQGRRLYMAMICGQEGKLPICVGQQMSMICAQKTNSRSCVAQQTNIIYRPKPDFLTLVAQGILTQPPFCYASVMYCDNVRQMLNVAQFLFGEIDRSKPIVEVSVSFPRLSSQIQ